MSKLYNIQLTDTQHQQLHQLIHSGKSAARVQTRARILLLAEQGMSDVQVAQALLTSSTNVQRTRQRFCQKGFERALYDEPRPGRPPRISGEVEAHLVMLACSSPPEGRSRWTLQLLADKMVELGYIDTISDQAVYNKLKKTNFVLGQSSSGVSPNRVPNS
jgi:transposase